MARSESGKYEIVMNWDNSIDPEDSNGILDSIDQDKVVCWLEEWIKAGFMSRFQDDTNEDPDGSTFHVELGADNGKTTGPAYEPSKLTIVLPKAELRIVVSVEQTWTE